MKNGKKLRKMGKNSEKRKNFKCVSKKMRENVEALALQALNYDSNIFKYA